MQRENHDFTGGNTSGNELSMADVIRRFGKPFLERHRARVPGRHRKAMRAIARCRTEALGGHVLECTCCRHQRYAYHSCRHRACPRCLREEREAWVKARLAELLPVPYLHIVFSIPNRLHALIRAHQTDTYPLLMTAVNKALAELGANPKYLGGTLAVMTTLHTAARTLAYHPHVHCVLPAGGVDKMGIWRPFKNPLFAPKKVLAQAFRKALMTLWPDTLNDTEFPEDGPCAGWKVYVEQPVHGIEKVLRYLARSLFHGPMHKHRILDITESHVVLEYPGPDRSDTRTMTLEGTEMLRRFLQHVWPDRIHKVRYSGLWSRKRRAQLNALKNHLQATAAATATALPTQETAGPTHETNTAPTPIWQKCPHCSGPCVIVALFTPGTTPPPLKRPLPLGLPPPPTVPSP